MKRFLVTLISALLALFIANVLVIPAFAQEYPTIGVGEVVEGAVGCWVDSVGVVNVRAAASSDSSIVAVLDGEVEILARSENWVLVIQGEVTGYVADHLVYGEQDCMLTDLRSYVALRDQAQENQYLECSVAQLRIQLYSREGYSDYAVGEQHGMWLYAFGQLIGQATEEFGFRPTSAFLSHSYDVSHAANSLSWEGYQSYKDIQVMQTSAGYLLSARYDGRLYIGNIKSSEMKAVTLPENRDGFLYNDESSPYYFMYDPVNNLFFTQTRDENNTLLVGKPVMTELTGLPCTQY